MKILSMIGLLMACGLHANTGRMCDTSYFQIGGNYTHAEITVDGESPFSGNLGGIQASYEYKPLNFLYAGSRVAWKQGETNDDLAQRDLVYVDVQERIGYTYSPCYSHWSLTAFTGVGYRYLGYHLKQDELPEEENTIDFKYSEFYVPVGLLTEYFFSSCWSLGLNTIWMPQVDSNVEIIPLKGARWMLQRNLGNVLVELPVTYFFQKCKHYSIVFKPFYERWGDGRSIAKTASGQSLDLPKNSYNFWGADLNFVFSF